MENIFANDTTNKGLISKIYKELTQLHIRNESNPSEKWAKGLAWCGSVDCMQVYEPKCHRFNSQSRAHA